MAPEQAAGARQIGPAVDVYALGAILFECLAGHAPVHRHRADERDAESGERAPARRALVPPRGAPRPRRGHDEMFGERPGPAVRECRGVGGRPAPFLDDRPTKARPVTNFERLWLSVKRNPSVAGLLAVLALVLCTAFVTFGVMWVRAEKRPTTRKG
ncbi:hypothetical protein J8F10_22660 [Gemmata sp. G18]|uniref:Protein kinase domain-containing protein n=1 Tax=Gemmata palustris TaxID=2822762 RepID=A0ABS5BWL7_9BACT|nr:hypothetical protein [Gemmata palustris]